jgi:hypothetical protein
MTEPSPNHPQDLPKFLADLAMAQEHDRALTAQIEQAVGEADQGKFASDQHVAEMRARRWKE